MTPRKLTDSDKQRILELYRQPGETTSTLASRYGVSNSTISRILKSSFSEEEYEALIQQKRARSFGDGPMTETDSPDVASESVNPSLFAEDAATEDTAIELKTDAEPSAAEVPASTGRRSRRRSSAPTEMPTQLELETQAEQNLQPDASLLDVSPLIELASAVELNGTTLDSSNGNYSPETTAVEEEIFGEGLIDQEEDLTGLDEDLDEDEDDIDDDLDDDLEQGSLLLGSRGEGKTLVQVLPLREASIPRTCYLVVDRSAELIARPLKEFGDLGQIPEAEIQEKTLPVFDNHRVAKRYSNPRTQRVIKLPDGKVLQKTSSHLHAKGITRLLIDGQVYSLDDEEFEE